MDFNRVRIAEQQRKKRIFNNKWRQIGLDVDAINYQVHEKLLERAKKEELEKAYAEQAKRQNDLAELLEEEKEKETREENKKINEYRRSEQRPQYRKEFDLNDPDHKKKERPPRILDDEECPLSSLQKFQGEDLALKSRSKKQKDQARDLLLQQMHEKRLQNFKEEKEKHDWESIMVQYDNLALQMKQVEEEYKKHLASQLVDENKSIATLRKEMELQQKIREDIEKQKDIEFHTGSDLLSENPSVARSTFSPNRVVPDRWKGMSPKQLEEYYKGQVQQIVEKQRRREQEQHENSKWDELLLSMDTVSKLKEAEQKKALVELDKKLKSENRYLAQTQKQQQDYFNKVVYANSVTKDYYDQFNTTSR